jgi:F-type H+-transporting ATPase subunit b
MVVILRAWAYKPILKMLEDRRNRIAQGLEDARVAADARANAEKEAEEVLTSAQQEAAAKVRESTDRAEEPHKKSSEKPWMKNGSMPSSKVSSVV